MPFALMKKSIYLDINTSFEKPINTNNIRVLSWELTQTLEYMTGYDVPFGFPSCMGNVLLGMLEFIVYILENI